MYTVATSSVHSALLPNGLQTAYAAAAITGLGLESALLLLK
jgi:hypothetical protein